MVVPSGIEPFDARLGGLRRGGLYLLAGAPGAGKMPFLLQFLSAGLDTDERLGLLAGYSATEVFARARRWGLVGLEPAWQDGRFVVLGFRGEFPRRILQASDPQAAFGELTNLLEGPVGRFAVDPGTLLWETRAGTAMADAFLAWHESLGATLVATTAADLEVGVTVSTERVLLSAAGAFHLARTHAALRELSIHRLRPPVPEAGPITLGLVEGSGLIAPTAPPNRRAGDAYPTGRRRWLVLKLATEIQDDVRAWMEGEYEVTQVPDSVQLISRVRAEVPAGICIMVDRAEVERAIDLCRATRPLTGGAIVVLSRGQLRSADRARAIEAGADDVLQQDVVLRELQSRFRRASAGVSGRRGWQAGDDRLEPVRELLDPDRFAEEVRSRLDSPAHGYLTLIVVPASVGDRASAALRSTLRVDAGDFMGRAPGGFGVVLQDARRRHALVYLERALDALDPCFGASEARILTSPEEVEEIRAWISG